MSISINMYPVCACDDQTQYECGGLGKDRCPYTLMIADQREIHVALCASRHDIPEAVNGSIFPEVIEDPMDFDGLFNTARKMLIPLLAGVETVNIYVTGMTPALLQCINVVKTYNKLGHNVVINTWHYNRNDGTYKCLPMK